MSEAFQQYGEGNVVRLGAQVELLGQLVGHGNRIEIGDGAIPSRIRLRMHGNHNRLIIGQAHEIKDLQISFGSHVPAHNVRIEIGDEFTIESGGRFLLYNSGNRLTIGDRCMFSSGITVRGGESPHLIFDRATGAYLDISDGVSIGHHVWVGERVYITKSVSIADETVVGACSVVTKRFTETHVALAGNPARVVRQNVQWIRNAPLIEPDSAYARSFAERQAMFPHPPED